MYIHGLDNKSVDAFVAQFTVAMHKAMHTTMGIKTYALSAAADPETTALHAVDAIAAVQTVWSQETETSLAPLLVNIYVTSAETVASQFAGTAEGVSIAPPSNDYAKHVLEASLHHVQSFGAELHSVAAKQISMGLADGSSIDEIADSIVEVAHLKEAKAHTIAQTAVIGAVNGGEWAQMQHMASAFDLAVSKEWEATEDSHTRPTHAAADGQVVGLTEKFTVGDAFLDFPGDPTGLAGEIVNCRCTMLFDVDESGVEGLTAAWDPHLHPRGKDGKFIESGHIGHVLFDVLKGADLPSLHGGEHQKLAAEILHLSPKDWHNLKDNDKETIEKAASDLLDLGVPGSAKAVNHLEDIADQTPEIKLRKGEDVFNPETNVPQATPLDATDAWHHVDEFSDSLYHASGGYKLTTKGANVVLQKRKTNGEWDAGTPVDEGSIPLGNWTSVEVPHKKPFPQKKKITGKKFFIAPFPEKHTFNPAQHASQGEKKPTEIPATHTATPFEILTDTGENGDGYAAPGLWGKFGAAGVMIAAPGDDGQPRFLMVQRGPMVSSNKGKWQLAGGALNSKESPEQGAAREIFEEIGAPQEYLATMKKVGSHDVEVPIEGKPAWKYSNIVAEAPTQFDPKIDGTETGDAKWLTEDEIKQMAAYSQLHPALAKNLSQVFDVYHSGKSDISMGKKSDVGDVAQVDTTPSVPSTPMDEIVEHSPNAPTSTILKASPVKMTHVLIHAKHQPGETIATTKTTGGTVKIKWNGKEYEVSLGKTNGPGGAVTKVKKSGLYAYLAKNFPNAQWYAPGKQNIEINALGVPTKKTSGVATADKLLETGDKLGVDLDEMFGPSPSIKKFSSDEALAVQNKTQNAFNAGHITMHQANELDKLSLKSPAAAQAVLDSYMDQASLKPKTPEKPLTPSPTEVVHNMAGWKKIGGQGGTNKGGLFQAPDGTKYYVKSQKSADHARNEVLAASLYRAAGLDIPEVSFAQNGPNGWNNLTASKIVETKDAAFKLKNDASFREKVQQGFAVDAWVANWDTVGLTFDNIKDKDGQPFRIDAGGSLRYRAQGGVKDFPADNVMELESLRNSKYSPQASQVFGEMTPTQIRDSAKKLQGITDNQINQLVDDAGYTGGDAEKMKTALKGRRDFILNKYNLTQNSAPAMIEDPIVSKVDPVEAPAPKLPPLPTTSGPGMQNTEKQQSQAVAWASAASKENWDQLTPQDKQSIESLVHGATIDSANEDGDWNPDLEDLNNKVASWVYDDPSLYNNGGPVTHTSPSSLPSTNQSSPPTGQMNWADMVHGYGQATKNGSLVAVDETGNYQLNKMTLGDGVVAYVLQSSNAKLGIYTEHDLQNGVLESNYGNLVWKPAGLGAMGTIPTLPGDVHTPTHPTDGIEHLTYSQKANFYEHFKDEKVSPAWSGAKIYNSLQAAKTKMSSDPAIAALSDKQMLELVDDAHMKKKIGYYYKQSVKNVTEQQPYSTKVREWLKTPNGKKAALAAKQGGWATGTVPMKKAVKKATPQSYRPYDMGTTDMAQVKELFPDSKLQQVYDQVKGQASGNSVKSPPAELFHTAHKIGEANGMSESMVLAAMDVKTQEKYSNVSHTYLDTIKQWLATPNGNKIANEIQAGTYAPPKKSYGGSKKSYSGSSYGSSYGGNYTHEASKPIHEKVPNLGTTGIPSFDSKKQSDFKTITTANAKTHWQEMVKEDAISGGQKSSLVYYTSNAGYTAMNKYLRGQQGATDATHNHVKNAQLGMRRSKKDLLLHRGQGSFAGWTSYEDALKWQGKTFHQEGFFSTSVGGKEAFSSRLFTFEIEAPAGTPMAYLAGISHYKSENEMLLAANLRYQVISVTPKTSYGGKGAVVRLRVIPDNVSSTGTDVNLEIANEGEEDIS